MLVFHVQCRVCRWAGELRIEEQTDIPVGARLALIRHGQVSPRCPARMGAFEVRQVAGPSVEPRWMAPEGGWPANGEAHA